MTTHLDTPGEPGTLARTGKLSPQKRAQIDMEKKHGKRTRS